MNSLRDNYGYLEKKKKDKRPANFNLVKLYNLICSRCYGYLINGLGILILKGAAKCEMY